MKDLNKILVINPGSTTTKVAVFENEKSLGEKNLTHTADDLAKYDNDAMAQLSMRRDAILDFLKEMNLELKDIDAIAARGCGRWGRYSAGAYKINDLMAEDSSKGKGGHGSALSAILANQWAKEYDIPAYLYDVVPVDEMEEVARISGLKEIERSGASHTLNTKATARKVAREELGKNYEDVTFIMCHMGGGCAANLHKKGKIVDVTSNDEGTFSPERAGKVPCGALVKMCFSGKFSQKEIETMLNGRGGLISYLGVNEATEVEKMIAEGNEYAALVYDAMAYQIAKDIGALAAAAEGQVDRIVLTGGIAHSKMFTDAIKKRVEWICPVVVVPGAMEMEALAKGILRVLRGEEEAREYNPGVDPLC